MNETTRPMFNGSIPEWSSSFYSWPLTSSNSGAVTTTHSSATPAGLFVNYFIWVTLESLLNEIFAHFIILKSVEVYVPLNSNFFKFGLLTSVQQYNFFSCFKVSQFESKNYNNPCAVKIRK